MNETINLIELSKEKIDALFDQHEYDPENVLLDLYHIVLPGDWDEYPKFHGWPKISNATWEYICGKFFRIGGLGLAFVWVNNGFSKFDKPGDDWVIDATDFLANLEET
jgi:hypothetical protein